MNNRFFLFFLLISVLSLSSVSAVWERPNYVQFIGTPQNNTVLNMTSIAISTLLGCNGLQTINTDQHGFLVCGTDDTTAGGVNATNASFANNASFASNASFVKHSGVEICSENQILKVVSGIWTCSADASGGGGGSGDKWLNANNYLSVNSSFADVLNVSAIHLQAGLLDLANWSSYHLNLTGQLCVDSTCRDVIWNATVPFSYSVLDPLEVNQTTFNTLFGVVATNISALNSSISGFLSANDLDGLEANQTTFNTLFGVVATNISALNGSHTNFLTVSDLDGLEANQTTFNTLFGVVATNISTLNVTLLNFIASGNLTGKNAGGDLTGTYPNPTINTGAVQDAEIDYSAVTLNDFTNDAGFLLNSSDVTFRHINATNTTIKNMSVNGGVICYNGTAFGFGVSSTPCQTMT